MPIFKLKKRASNINPKFVDCVLEKMLFIYVHIRVYLHIYEARFPETRSLNVALTFETNFFFGMALNKFGKRALLYYTAHMKYIPNIGILAQHIGKYNFKIPLSLLCSVQNNPQMQHDRCKLCGRFRQQTDYFTSTWNPIPDQ